MMEEILAERATATASIERIKASIASMEEQNDAFAVRLHEFAIHGEPIAIGLPKSQF
jgi:hypothetical protein